MFRKANYTTDVTDSHYMTPGARLYFKRVVLGYVALALAMTVGVFATTKAIDQKLRNDLNKIAQKQCLASIPTYKKLNEGLQAQIEIQKDAFHLNLSQGDVRRASLNRDAIKKLQDAKLNAPTKKTCKRKLV